MTVDSERERLTRNLERTRQLAADISDRMTVEFSDPVAYARLEDDLERTNREIARLETALGRVGNQPVIIIPDDGEQPNMPEKVKSPVPVLWLAGGGLAVLAGIIAVVVTILSGGTTPETRTPTAVAVVPFGTGITTASTTNVVTSPATTALATTSAVTTPAASTAVATTPASTTPPVTLKPAVSRGAFKKNYSADFEAQNLSVATTNDDPEDAGQNVVSFNGSLSNIGYQKINFGATGATKVELRLATRGTISVFEKLPARIDLIEVAKIYPKINSTPVSGINTAAVISNDALRAFITPASGVVINNDPVKAVITPAAINTFGIPPTVGPATTKPAALPPSVEIGIWTANPACVLEKGVVALCGTRLGLVSLAPPFTWKSQVINLNAASLRNDQPIFFEIVYPDAGSNRLMLNWFRFIQ